MRYKNIPSISEYSHWNEEAASVWYAENRYDMMYPEDDYDDYDDYDDRDYYDDED